ncbi:hypothetical protein ACWFRM_42575, partial [Streptomyces sp. NPDC055144]
MNLAEGFCRSKRRGTFYVQRIGFPPRVHVSADGSEVVGQSAARLRADLADATGLTAAYSTALRSLRPRGTGHDPGRIATDLAVMLASGGEAIADLAVLRDQAGVFGPVVSPPTAWRLLADVDPDLREHGLNLRFSVGYAVTEPVRRAIRSLPEALWHPALDQNVTLRDGSEVAELTGKVDLAGHPAGVRALPGPPRRLRTRPSSPPVRGGCSTGGP